MINLCWIEIFFGDLISFFKGTSEDDIIRAQTITEINNIKGKTAAGLWREHMEKASKEETHGWW